MKRLIPIVLLALLAGCAQNSYKQFYKPYVDAKTLPEVELLAANQEPKIFNTDNFDRDVLDLRSKNYIPIGHSSFNGGYEDVKNVEAQAKLVGATIVLVGATYTNTETTTATLFLPDNKTTYHTGTATSNTSYKGNSGAYLGNSNSSTTYNGTSTTFGTQAVPITTNQRRYDQNAVFFVKSTQKMKFGFYFNDLSQEQRRQLERNTGVLVNAVIENSPVFNANLLVGDIVISIDEKPLVNTEQAGQIMSNISPEQKSCVFKIIRNGTEKIITVQF